MPISNLQTEIELIFSLTTKLTDIDRQRALDTFGKFKTALNRGEVRAVSRRDDGQWQVHAWVKRGILLGFRLGGMVDYSIDDNFRYFDKETYPTKRLTITDGVRVVPGGTTVRFARTTSSAASSPRHSSAPARCSARASRSRRRSRSCTRVSPWESRSPSRSTPR